MNIPLALCASTIDDSLLNNKKKQMMLNNNQKTDRDNFSNKDKISSMKNAISSIHKNNTPNTDDFDTNLANFETITTPDSAFISSNKETSDEPVNDFQYNTQSMPLSQAYKQSTIQNSLSYGSNNDQQQILDKLDKIIRLFEASHDSKTNSRVEEVILYSFLGVFIIYVLDSFARIGKYVR